MRGDWRRQRDEPPGAHALFEQYLQLGPGRRLRTLAKRGAASYSYLKKLSHLWRWQERAAGWQATLQQAGDLDAAELAAQARNRQIRDAQTMIQLARAQLARWIAKDGDGTTRLQRRLTPHQTARLWQTGYRLEHELLPPFTPDGPVDVGERLRKAEYEREDDDEEKTTEPPKDLLEEMAKLIMVLRRHLSRREVVDHHAKLLRWLWLPGKKSLSLDAISKANRTRSLRKRNHVTGQTTKKEAARA